MERLRDDSGVVAIIVALSISTFLLGFAALAVDLGVAYARKAQLQSAADRLALATAQALPATTGSNTDGSPGARAAFKTQWAQLCQGDDDSAVWPAKWCPSAGWAFDQDPDNGEVEFLNDSTGGLTYALPASPGPLAATATAVRVDLPPSTVNFGFAASFGASSTEVHKAASARLGTPLGAGILPFPVGEGEVDVGQVCVTDNKVGAALPTTYSPKTNASSPRADVISPIPATEVYDPEYLSAPAVPVTLRLTMNKSYPTGNPGTFKVRIGTSPDEIDPESVGPRLFYWDLAGFHWYYDITVKIPYQAPGTVLDIWVTGQHRKSGFGSKWVTFDSLAGKLTFLGRPLNDNPCALPQAVNRGYAPMSRTTSTQQLTRNIRSGPQSDLYTTGMLTGLLNPVLDGCLLNTPVQVGTTCLISAKTDNMSQEIKNGLLSSGDGRSGRMVGDCGNGTTSSNGYAGIDASRLVNTGSNLVDPKWGSGLALRNNIVNNWPVKPAWVTAKALRCPRMAVLPVVSDTLAAPGPNGGRPITGFVYFWIDGISSDRGLVWGSGGKLQSLSGYVIKPEYLPSVVAGSLAVGPYLGDSMPKEATLICDLGDRKLGRCA